MMVKAMTNDFFIQTQLLFESFNLSNLTTFIIMSVQFYRM